MAAYRARPDASGFRLHTLGFAVNAAAGFNEWPWAGGEEINAPPAPQPRSGITAFDLAPAGTRSSESALEGQDGMFAARGGRRT